MSRQSLVLIFLFLLPGLLVPNQTIQAYSLHLPESLSASYSISGQVTDGSGNGVEGVTVHASWEPVMIFLPLVEKPGGNARVFNLPSKKNIHPIVNTSTTFTTTTDASGIYTFTSLASGSYNLTVEKDGIVFNPANRRVTMPNTTSQEFQVQILPPVILPTTQVISPETNQYLQSLSTDGAVFTYTQTTQELQSLAIGDIIVSDVITNAPNGYLRKVISVANQSGNVVINTEPTVLEEAVQDGSVYIKDTLMPAKVMQTRALPGVTMRPATPNSTTFYFEVNDVVLYDADGNLSTKSDQVKANGKIEFEMDYEFYLNIHNFELSNLTFANRNTVRDTIEILSEVKLASLQKEKILASQAFAPLTVMVGPVPVIFVPRLDVVVGVDGSVKVGISTNVSHELSMRAGVEYVTPAGWHPISEQTNKFSFTPPQITLEAKAKGYFGTRFNLYLYGVAGPYVKVTPFLELKIAPLETPWWVLSAGVDVPAGFRAVDEFKQGVRWIGLKLDDYEVVAVGVKEVLAQAQTINHAPNGPSNPGPVDSATGVDTSTSLSWVGGDPDGDTITYDVYMEAGDSSPDVLVSKKQATTSFNPSPLATNTTYYWQINATDNYGWSTASPVWVFTTNQPPNTPSNPSPANNVGERFLNVSLSWTGGDPDGDAVTYDVYFEAGNSTPDVLVSNDQTGTRYYSGLLDGNTTYYRKIVSLDEYGAIRPGPVWNFTTGDSSKMPGEMILIPAGEFLMGCDPAHNGDYSCDRPQELPLHTVYLDAFSIDKYEVTNAQYAQCVASWGCTPPSNNSSNTRSSYYDNPVYGNYPVINVSWYDAQEYCFMVGKRLPTEAQWDKAARGPSVRAYPWGDGSPDCSLANSSFCTADTTAVGSFPAGASPYGVMDMAGNVSSAKQSVHKNANENVHLIAVEMSTAIL